MEIISSLFMSLYEVWDLLAVGIVICVTVMLGFIVFLGNTKSATHKTFLGFSLLVALWGTLNYLSYQPIHVVEAFAILRFTLFAVTWMTFCFLLFAWSFPKERTGLPKIILLILVIWTTIVSILTLTPLVLEAVRSISPEGIITSAINGPAIPVFGMTTTLYTLAGIVLLIIKTLRAQKLDRKRFLWITLGVLIMFFSIVTSNLILPVVFNNPSYLPLAAVFVFPFIALTSYAVIKYNILNIRIIGVEIFITGLLLISLIRLIEARNFGQVLPELVIFIGLVTTSVLILRSVLKEVEQREQLQRLTEKLEAANVELKRLDAAKSEFISIASHQLRTPLTAAKGYLSLALEGTYGKLAEKVKKPIAKVYESNERLIHLVNDLLSLSRIESGKMKLEPVDTNIEQMIESIVDELKVKATQKNLELIFQKPKSALPILRVDSEKVRNAVLNIIDNSIRYTNKGSITVHAAQLENAIRITITDTGEGMTKEEIAKLFESFSRGEAGAKLSTEGAGLGLYIAKQFVQMHKAKIWAESEGKGKGSTFYIELPSV